MALIKSYKGKSPRWGKDCYFSESATGVNMTDIVRANTIDAKVNRNINLDSDSKVDVKK